MTVDAIKDAIEQLPESERRKLADWFADLDEQAWDAEMERDFSPGGRGLRLVEKINEETNTRGFTLLDDGFRSPTRATVNFTSDHRLCEFGMV